MNSSPWTPKQWRCVREILRYVVILLISISMIAGGVHVHFAADTEYAYTVKAELVNEDEMVDEAVSYENLSDPEREVLYRAFKKSDHFMGGSEAHVVVDEPLNVSDEWRVIEIHGVPLLVAISGPEERIDPASGIGGTLVLLCGIIGVMYSSGRLIKLRNRGYF